MLRALLSICCLHCLSQESRYVVMTFCTAGSSDLLMNFYLPYDVTPQLLKTAFLLSNRSEIENYSLLSIP